MRRWNWRHLCLQTLPQRTVQTCHLCRQRMDSGWGYVWGTFGQVLTPELLQYKISQHPEGVGDEANFIRSHWLNRRTTDCVGLIKGYGWLNTETMEIQYGSNGMPDVGADGMYYNAGRKRQH